MERDFALTCSRRGWAALAITLAFAAACSNLAPPAAPMVPASEPLPGHGTDAGEAGSWDADADVGPDAEATDGEAAGEGDAASCAAYGHSLKMPTMNDCVKKCGELPAGASRCPSRDACKRRCYGTFGPM